MRKVPEWKGKTDDAALPSHLRLRLTERVGGRCPLCTREFSERLRPEFDHIVALSLGGQHRESNLRAICGECHKPKTKADANATGRARRIAKKRYGIDKPKRKWPGQSKFKKKLDGTVVLRNEDD